MANKGQLRRIARGIYVPADKISENEALKDTLSQNKASLDDIFFIAKSCRMLNVIRPYLEMV